MKKLTGKKKLRHKICSRNAYRRKRAHRAKKKGRKTSGKAFKLRKTEIQLPNNFSLESNFNEVVSAITEMRNQSEIHQNTPSDQVFILMQDIHEISPAGALVLMAEIHRWTSTPRARRLKSSTPPNWNQQVRRLLDDMGFFRLLGLDAFEQSHTENEDIRYMKCRTGKKSDGDAVLKLRDELESIVGEIPGNQYLYTAVTEAMTNVRQHAYPQDRIVTNWWLSASYHAEEKEVHILIYDQGSGIPATLHSKLTQDVGSRLFNDHAGLIEKAHDPERSASALKHRGNGLKIDIRGYLSKLNCTGHYRVISLRGEYKCTKEGPTMIPDKFNHSYPLKGTLIEWRLRLTDE